MLGTDGVFLSVPCFYDLVGKVFLSIQFNGKYRHFGFVRHSLVHNEVKASCVEQVCVRWIVTENLCDCDFLFHSVLAAGELKIADGVIECLQECLFCFCAVGLDSECAGHCCALGNPRFAVGADVLYQLVSIILIIQLMKAYHIFVAVQQNQLLAGA